MMTNAGFDNATNEWSFSRAPVNGVVPPAKAPPFSQIDAGECPTSGSLALNGDAGVWSPLFPVTGGSTYYMGFLFRPVTKPSDPSQLALFCTIDWCSAADCQTNADHILSGGDPLLLRNYDAKKEWQRIDEVTTAPLTAVAGFLSCAAEPSYLDRFYVSTTTPLF